MVRAAPGDAPAQHRRSAISSILGGGLRQTFFFPPIRERISTHKLFEIRFLVVFGDLKAFLMGGKKGLGSTVGLLVGLHVGLGV